MQTENLLTQARRRFSDLNPQDAFVAPRWYLSQENWIAGTNNVSAAAYNYPLGLRIHGPLNLAAAQKSVNALIQRHQVLRSAFRIHDGEVLQIICGAQSSAISMIDLSGLKPSRREAQAPYVAAHCAKELFDFSLGPLLRAAAITLAEDDHVVLLTTHHIVCDDWSAGILVRDFLELYDAFRAGAASPKHPELKFQYGDFVRWRQTDAKQLALSQSRDFWKQELSQSGRLASFAPNKPFLAQQTFQSAHETLCLPGELLRDLIDMSQRERVSLFMTLLAGFQLLLKHHSGSSQVSVGCCVANRERPDTELLVGPFANVVVLQTPLENHLSIREAIGRVRERALDAYSHQDLPFGELVREMGYDADAAGNPFFQVLFVLQNAPRPRASTPEIGVEDFPIDLGSTRYDVNLWLTTADGLALDLQYNTNLFAPETITKVLRDYKRTLEWMVRNPDARISALFSAESLKSGAQSESAPAPAIEFHTRDEYEKTLLALWRKAFRNGQLEADADFFEAGGDSLLAARLFADIQNEFGIRLPLSVLCNAPTVKKLAPCLRAAKKSDVQNSLVAVRARGSRPPLLVIHEHGGEVLYTRELARHLPGDQPVYAFQSRYEHGVPAFSTVEQMARAYVQELLAHQIRGPFFVFGYCFGGLIGVEMAARLKAAGKHVKLAMLDTPAPGSLRHWPFPGLRHVPARTRFFLQDFFALEPTHMPDFVFRKFRGAARALQANGKRRKFTQESAQQIGFDVVAKRGAHIWQVHLTAARSYRPQPIADELTLFVTPEAPSSYDFDLRTGWKKFAKSVRLVNVPGNVTTVMREPHVAVLAAQITKWMARCPSASIEEDMPIDDAPEQSRLAAHS